MEKREKTPPLEKIILIAERLGTTPEYILRGEQKEKPASEEAGFHPTLEDWLNAIDRMSREEMRAAVRSFASKPPPRKTNARIIP